MKDKEVVIVDKIIDIVPNKYEAIRVMAKEARRINDIILRSINWEGEAKPTTLALKRFLEGKIKYVYGEEERGPKGLFKDDD